MKLLYCKNKYRIPIILRLPLVPEIHQKLLVSFRNPGHKLVSSISVIRQMYKQSNMYEKHELRISQ